MRRDPQAVREARSRALGYDAGLLSLAALPMRSDGAARHCRRVAEVIPLFGFYLQPAVGGRVLDPFWRAFPKSEAWSRSRSRRSIAIDTGRGARRSRSGRDDMALYTGNDDAIVTDLVTPFPSSRTAGSLRRSSAACSVSGPCGQARGGTAARVQRRHAATWHRRRTRLGCWRGAE